MLARATHVPLHACLQAFTGMTLKELGLDPLPIVAAFVVCAATREPMQPLHCEVGPYLATGQL